MEESNDTLCVGIDLGTSRSSISASSGERHVIDSYVGWPMDMVARKLVKKSVLVGRDALDNRPMLDLRRPLERGIMKEGSEKDQEAVQEILRHLIGLAGIKQKSKNKVKVRAVVGVPAEAFRVNRQNLRSTMEGIADSVMLVSEPFAVAYGLEALLHALVIDIGAGTADFCVMQGRYPTEEDQKTLPNAGDAIDEQLMKLIRERHPDAQFSIHMLRDWKEKWSFVGEPKQRVIVSAPIKGKATDIDITQEMMLVSEPFAVAYGLEALLHALVIDIGAGTADFCVMQGRYPTEEDQKTLPNAGDAIDEQLMKLIRERHPDAQFSIHMLRDWKEKWSFVGEPKQRVIVSAPIKGKATEIDITQEMRTACESILPPICETMTTLLAKVEPEFQAKVRNNVILAGGTSLIAGLADAVTHALSELGGGRATVVKDPVFAGSDGSLAIAQDASSSDWEKLSL